MNMEFLNQINAIELFYAATTAFVTVGLIVLMRLFGNLPSSFFGPDLNLLTYGFLWDISIKAVRGLSYWPHFDEANWPIAKGATLLVIAIINFLLLAWNLKLSNLIDIKTQNGQNKTKYSEWFLKPVSLALGVFSLILFLILQSIWGYQK